MYQSCEGLSPKNFRLPMPLNTTDNNFDSFIDNIPELLLSTPRNGRNIDK